MQYQVLVMLVMVNSIWLSRQKTLQTWIQHSQVRTDLECKVLIEVIWVLGWHFTRRTRIQEWWQIKDLPNLNWALMRSKDFKVLGLQSRLQTNTDIHYTSKLSKKRIINRMVWERGCLVVKTYWFRDFSRKMRILQASNCVVLMKT